MLDFPRFDGGRREGRVCFKTFPNAVVCALSGKVVPAKPKGTTRREALRKRGRNDGALRNLDFVDAALCAVAAEAFRLGKTSRFGDRDEGIIVVPAIGATRRN